jgi:rRNA processing protein Gar1
MRTLLLATAAFALPVVAASCASPDADEVAVVDMKATAPDVVNGFQIKAPTTRVEVGSDIETCFVPDLTFDRDVYVLQADAYQGPVGHHVQLYGSAIPRRKGEVFDCSDLATMSTLLPLVTPNFPLVERDNKTQLPDNFYVRIPAGSLIVMQSHYVNYTDSPIEVADIVNIETVDDVTGMTESSYFVVSDNTFTVPEGQSTNTYECDVVEDVQLLYGFGHMHEQGKVFRIERTPAGGTTETLYSVDPWTAEYRDYAPIERYAVDAPLVLHAGDHLTMTCEYDNTKGEPLAWPREMCVFFSSYFPAKPEGFLLCGDG